LGKAYTYLRMLRGVLWTLVLCTTWADEPDTPPGKYTINLDTPGFDHFKQSTLDYKVQLQALMDFFISHYVPKQVLPLLNRVGAEIDQHIRAPYADEIRGISNYSGIGIGEVVLVNYLYDLSAFCTSTVAQDAHGRIFHARNLDYNFADLLRNLTVELEFVSKGVLQYKATTYVGYVGILTGMKPNAFTVSIDQRDAGHWWINWEEILFNHTGGMSMLIRDILATPGATFKDALHVYSTHELIAPVYIILGGMAPGEGAVITRNQTHAIDVWLLWQGDLPNNFWRLETNYDHWKPVPPDDDRRTPGNAAMQAMGNTAITKEALYNVMSTTKVYNPSTTYTTVMSAQDPSMYTTWVRHLH